MRNVGRVVLVLMATVALASGCGSGVSPTEQTAQQSTATAEAALREQGFTKVVLRIRHVDGSIEEHCVWLSDSEAERTRGLMDVTDPSLGGGDAMVFVFDADSQRAFWMKDAVLPLSIAWFDAGGVFIDSADMDPCPDGTDECPRFAPPSPYRLAIEMAQGRLQDWGLGPGSTVSVGGSCERAEPLLGFRGPFL